MLHRILRAAVGAILLALWAPPAHASCDALVKRAATVSPDQVGPTFAELARCDAAVAAEHFDDFLRRSKDVDTLVSLVFAAVDHGVYEPLWSMLDKIPDVALRDQVAADVGANCSGHDRFVEFVQQAHARLGDRQFGMWREALRACEAPALVDWLEQASGSPPAVPYDEKYNVVTDVYVRRKRAEALPVLQRAAVAAGASGGPFSTILDRMNEAVRPETFGAEIAPEDRARLEEALVEVAKQVPPELAAQVADRLYQAGAEEAAASLLPVVYADRVHGKGTLVYGVAAVESCENVAVIHYAEVTEPGTRWSIVSDVQEPARAFKPRLKCQSDEEWPVLTTPEPLAKGGLDAWVAELESEWAGKGLSVKLREEKAIALD